MCASPENVYLKVSGQCKKNLLTLEEEMKIIEGFFFFFSFSALNRRKILFYDTRKLQPNFRQRHY
jgi:hypothetical protein